MVRTINHRREPRHLVRMPAFCHTATGRRGEVEMVDLTPDGCRIFCMALPLSEGLRLRIRPNDFASLPGVVRWTSRGFAGIAFDSPLYGPVAEHLQRRFGAG